MVSMSSWLVSLAQQPQGWVLNASLLVARMNSTILLLIVSADAGFMKFVPPAVVWVGGTMFILSVFDTGIVDGVLWSAPVYAKASVTFC